MCDGEESVERFDGDPSLLGEMMLPSAFAALSFSNSDISRRFWALFSSFPRRSSSDMADSGALRGIEFAETVLRISQLRNEALFFHRNVRLI